MWNPNQSNKQTNKETKSYGMALIRNVDSGMDDFQVQLISAHFSATQSMAIFFVNATMATPQSIYKKYFQVSWAPTKTIWNAGTFLTYYPKISTFIYSLGSNSICKYLL